MGKSVSVETRKTNTHVELWGVKKGQVWWDDATGVVFHTPHKRIAELQADELRSRGVADARAEQIQ